jgi:CTP:molybdopterin cytidylyltransferase MocA
MGAVVLAAGAARRMGGRPKCLLERDGEALILGLLRALGGAGLTNPVVVLGHHAQRIAAVLRGTAHTPTLNPEPDAGRASSLRQGLWALPAHVDAVLVLLADQPLINTQDIRDLLAAYQARPPGIEWVQPVVSGLPGNPVIFSAVVREQVLAGLPDMGGKQWQAVHPEAVWAWASDNAHYRTDVDSLQDIEALGQRTGHWLRWPDDLALPL